MNGNGIFVLAEKVAGNFYVSKGIQGMAGKEVVPEGFDVRKTDPDKSVLAVVRGKDGRCQSLSFRYFSQHPPEDGLRHLAAMI